MIWTRLTAQAASRPEQIAIRYGGQALTYRELVDGVAARAESLPRPAVPGCHRAFVQEPDPLSLLVHMLTCWAVGFVPVIFRDGATPAQVAELRIDFAPVVELGGMVEMISLKESAAGAQLPECPLGPADEALVLCTSGTTGAPKLVALPARGVLVNAEVIADSLELQVGDRVAVNTPLTYMYGLLGGVLPTLLRGATLCLFSPREPLTQVQAAIRHDRLTVVQGPPSLMRLFLTYWNQGRPFETVRLVTTGGEGLAPAVRAGLMEAFPRAKHLFLFGMTEAGPRLSHLPFAEGGGEAGIVGRPYAHVDWRLEASDSQSAGGDALAGRRGRLALRGDSIFLGYLQADGTYRGKDEEGWFLSNDVLEVVDDQRMRFLGRVDRVFKSGGKLVNPDEIEAALRRLPMVEEALCYQLEHRLLGYVPAVDVSLKSGVTATEAEILQAVRALLEPQAHPRTLRIVAGWSVGESGKRGLTQPDDPAAC